jgi:hypothetical protein
VSATEVDRVLERAKLNLFFASILAGQPEAFAISDGVIGRGLPIKTLCRARTGLDPNCVRPDLDHLVIADQQPDAAEMDLTPAFGDAKKLIRRPAEAQSLVSVAGGEEDPQSINSRLPVRVANVGRGSGLNGLQEGSVALAGQFEGRAAVAVGAHQLHDGRLVPWPVRQGCLCRN